MKAKVAKKVEKKWSVAKKARCTCNSGSPILEKGQRISITGGCCGGMGPAVFDLGERGRRCTMCVMSSDQPILSVVAADHPLMEEAREWDPDADYYVEIYGEGVRS